MMNSKYEQPDQGEELLIWIWALNGLYAAFGNNSLVCSLCLSTPMYESIPFSFPILPLPLLLLLLHFLFILSFCTFVLSECGGLSMLRFHCLSLHVLKVIICSAACGSASFVMDLALVGVGEQELNAKCYRCFSLLGY